MNLKKTIFLADDDEDDRFFLRDAINQIENNIEIIEAVNGPDLLEILKTHPHTQDVLIVLDMNMPRLNGLETIQAIRMNPAYAPIPAVMISTSSDRWLIEQVKQAGIDKFVTKPSTMEGFLCLARELCDSF